jgi:hypothetical protein
MVCFERESEFPRIESFKEFVSGHFLEPLNIKELELRSDVLANSILTAIVEVRLF